MILVDRWEIFAKPVKEDSAKIFTASEAKCREWIADRPDADDFVLRRQPWCSCCGAYNDFGKRMDVIQVRRRPTALYRCAKHRAFNPCAVTGCARTRGCSDDGYYDDTFWLCTEHFKLGCPPRSPTRQVYRRFFRLHEKRDGKGQRWSADLDRRYWRIWAAIVRRAQNAAAGDIDMAEINEMFGW